MAETRYEMSQIRLDELKKELEYLQTVRSAEVAEQIKEARSFGDLSENSEYDEAKTEQGKLYSRIADIQDLIDNAVIVEDVVIEGTVSHGSTVIIYDVELEEFNTYTIVSSQEANPDEGKISGDSPLGRAILGKKPGEAFYVDAPDGAIEYKVIDIKD